MNSPRLAIGGGGGGGGGKGGSKKHFIFEDSSKLHGHTNEHAQSRSVLPNQS